jgi:hypothetical protein
MLHGLQGLLLHSAHRRTTLDARSLLHRRRTLTASHQALGGGARGAGFDNTIVGTLQTATRLRRHRFLHSTSRRSAAGSSWLQDCWLRRHHLLHSAGCRRPAAAPGRLPSCSALGASAKTTPCCVICEQLSGNRLRLAVGGCPPLPYMALPQPSNRITTSHACTIHLMGPTPTPVALSGESIHSPVGPLSFFLRP